MDNPSLLTAINKLAISGERAGLSVEKMIQILNAGISMETLLQLIDSNHCCPAKISGGHSNPLKISMVTHGRIRNDLN